MNKKRLFTAATVALSILLTGCSTRQQASSTMETSVVESDKNKDTTKPTITFKADSVTVEVGADYKIEDNIKSVNDDTDGALKKVDKDKIKDGEAYYTIDDSDVSLKTAGEYTVKVTAKDSSGNVASNTFKLTVKEKAKEESKESSKAETKSSEKKSTASSSNKSTTSTKKSTSSGTSTQNKSTASNNTQSSTTSQNQTAQQDTGTSTGCDHNWVHVNAEYKTETRVISAEVSHDEDVTVGKYQCVACGALFDTLDEFDHHVDETGGQHGNYRSASVPTGEKRHVIDTPAQTETVQTLISPEHDECTKCGEWKS